MRAALVVLLLLAACATPADPAEPHAVVRAEAKRYQAPSDWHELRSPHFVLLSNLAVHRAKRAILRMELLRNAMLTVVWRGAQLAPGRLEVVASANLYELVRDADGQNFTFDETIDPMITYWLGDDTEPFTVHRLFHVYARQLDPPQPLWLKEGRARYFASLRVSEDGTSVEVGHPHDLSGFYSSRASAGRFSVARLLAMPDGPLVPANPEVPEFETGSWLLTTYLMLARPAVFVSFERALAHGDEPTPAFWRQLGGTTEAQLEDELQTFQKAANYEIHSTPLTALPEPPLQIRELAPAEVAAIRARLILAERGPPRSDLQARAEAELQPGLTADATSPAVLHALQALHPERSLCDEARAGVKSHAADPASWLFLASVLAAHPESTAERTAALERAAALDPGEVSTLRLLVRTQLDQEREADALAIAQRAVQLLPDSFDREALAVALAALHRCGEANAAEQQAMDAYSAERPKRDGALLSHWQAKVRALCPVAAPSSP